MNSISAQGITTAFRAAELLAGAIVAGLGGTRPLRVALAAHQRQRDRALRPMYDFTPRLADFTPRRVERLPPGPNPGQPRGSARCAAQRAGAPTVCPLSRPPHLRARR